LGAPHRRLMAAVLQTVVDDCRGSGYRRAAGYPAPTGRRRIHQALSYMANTDRVWPFSFENLCEALGLDAGRLRQQFAREGWDEDYDLRRLHGGLGAPILTRGGSRASAHALPLARGVT